MKRSNQYAIGFYGAGNMIPKLSDALFWLDGTIIEVEGSYYLRDRSGNNNHWPITGYDFDTTWTKGFPYKSAATISAPIDNEVLYNADVNRFMYSEDSSGTVNQIPVTSLFQDVDYEHKLFCRHADQVLDDNGVETYEPRVLDVVLYANAKSGADLTTCQSYYGVPVESATAYWIDPVNGVNQVSGGTKIAPWKTMTYAESQITTGTVYIITGAVSENLITPEKAIAWKALGFVTLSSSNSGVIRFSNSDAVRSFTGFSFKYDYNATVRTAVSYYTAVKNVTFNKCRFPNPTNTNASNCVFGTTAANFSNIIFNDCVFIHNSTTQSIYHVEYYTECNRCLFVGTIGRAVKTAGNDYVSKFKYNKIVGTYNTQLFTQPNNYDIRFNQIYNSGVGVCLSGSVGTGVTGSKFNYNVIIQANYLNGIGYIILSAGAPECKYNVITLSGVGETSDYNAGSIIYTSGLASVDVSDNIIIAGGARLTNAVSLSSNAATCASCKVNNNRIILSSAVNAQFIQLDGDVAGTRHNKFDGFEIKNNYCEGAGVGTSHGIFVFGNNGTIAYNKNIGGDHGITIKSENLTTTSLNIYSNVLVNNRLPFVISGTSGINFIGNTIKTTSPGSSQFGIDILANATYYSTNNILKNNIIQVNNVPIYYIDNANNTGNVIDYNCIYGSTTIGRVVVTNYNFADWNGLGYDEHSFNQDPNLTLYFWPIPAITGGEDLGTDYDDGLDIITDWGNDTQVPVIATKQQTGSWQIGAYVQ